MYIHILILLLMLFMNPIYASHKNKRDNNFPERQERIEKKIKIETEKNLFSLPTPLMNYLVTFFDPKSAKKFAQASKNCLKAIDSRRYLKIQEKLKLEIDEKQKFLNFVKRVDPKHLDFTDVSIPSDLFISILRCSSNLIKLTMDDFHGFNQENFLRVLETHPNLEYLSLLRCTEMSVSTIHKICQKFLKLKYLNIQNIKIQYISTRENINKLEHLNFLNIERTSIEENDFINLLPQFNSLSTLKLAYNTSISNGNFRNEVHKSA